MVRGARGATGVLAGLWYWLAWPSVVFAPTFLIAGLCGLDERIEYERWWQYTLDEIRAIGKDVRRRVAYDAFGEYEVSTVFIGMDFQHFEGPPMVFETMVFPGNQVWRWSTWEEAERGHRKIVEALKEGKEP